MKMKKTLIASSILATLIDSGAAHATLVTGIMGNFTFSTNYANFTMLSPTGATVGGTNNVSFTWDGNAFTSSSDYTGPGSFSNVTASSTSPFFSNLWSAHDIQVFIPGSYSFDTTLGGGTSESGLMNVTVPEGQLGMHMLFDWGGSINIDVFVVVALESMFGEGIVRTAANASSCDSGIIKNCLWSGNSVIGHKPFTNQIWMFATVDGDSDGIMGIPMAQGGPFAGFNASFNGNFDVITPATVPVPAAVWLFGSGLIGLFATSHRHKLSSF